MYTSPFKSVTIFTHFIYNLIYFIHILNGQICNKFQEITINLHNHL